MIGLSFYRFLSLASKIALTSPANSSKLVPKVAAKYKQQPILGHGMGF
jgi:hypothetical protein